MNIMIIDDSSETANRCQKIVRRYWPQANVSEPTSLISLDDIVTEIQSARVDLLVLDVKINTIRSVEPNWQDKEGFEIYARLLAKTSQLQLPVCAIYSGQSYRQQMQDYFYKIDQTLRYEEVVRERKLVFIKEEYDGCFDKFIEQLATSYSTKTIPGPCWASPTESASPDLEAFFWDDSLIGGYAKIIQHQSQYFEAALPQKLAEFQQWLGQAQVKSVLKAIDLNPPPYPLEIDIAESLLGQIYERLKARCADFANDSLPELPWKILLLDDEPEKVIAAAKKQNITGIHWLVPLCQYQQPLFVDTSQISRIATASNDYRQLLKYAIAYADGHCDIDLILLDLYFRGQFLGLEFVDRLANLRANLPLIVISSYRSLDYIIRAVSSGARWFVGKQQDSGGGSGFREPLQEVFYPHREIERRAYPRIVNDLGELAGQDLLLIQGLFPDYDRLYIEYLAAGRSTAKVLAVRPAYRRETPGNLCFVKIDHEEEIAKEKQNYQRFVRFRIDQFSGRIDHPPCYDRRTRRGALVYSLASSPWHSGSHPCSEIGEFISCVDRSRRDLKKVAQKLIQILSHWPVERPQRGKLNFGQHCAQFAPPLMEIELQQIAPLSPDAKPIFDFTSSNILDPWSIGQLIHIDNGAIVRILPEQRKIQLRWVDSYRISGPKIEIVDVPPKIFASRKLKFGKQLPLSATIRADWFQLLSQPLAGLEAIGFHIDDRQIILESTGLVLVNPIQALPQIVAAIHRHHIPVREGFIHGDLNTTNVKVDEEHHYLWLFDFAQTGYGAKVFDIAKLETEIINTICASHITASGPVQEFRDKLVEFYRSYRRLSHLPEPGSSNSNALYFIHCLRREALRQQLIMCRRHQKELDLKVALYFCALNTLRYQIGQTYSAAFALLVAAHWAEQLMIALPAK